MRFEKSGVMCASLLSVILLFTGCNRMEKDAKKAAKLTDKSIEQMHELKLQESEKSYKEAQKIIQKYEQKGKSEKFLPKYRKYRDDGKRLHTGES